MNQGAQKAVYGAVVAALVAALSVLAPAANNGGISSGDWWNAALAVFVSLGAVGGTVYQVTNKPTVPADPAEGLSDDA